MSELSLALACALSLTGLPPPDALPAWDARALTRAEWALTNRPHGARAMYDWRTRTIVAPPGDWPALVHEMVHHLECAGGYRFSERRAEAAEIRAYACVR